MSKEDSLFEIKSFERLLTEDDEQYGINLIFGSQSFKIDYYGNREEVEWMKGMLSGAIKNLIYKTREETIKEVEEMLSKIVLKDLSGKWSEEVIDFSTSIVDATVLKIKQSLKSLINK